MTQTRARPRLGAALQQALGPRGGGAPERETRAPAAGLFGHPVRAQLYQDVLDRPLSHIAVLARGCALSPPSTRWHVGVMERAGVVRVKRAGREVRVFASGSLEGENEQALRALRGPLVLKVLRQVNASPGSALREMAAQVKASPQSVLRALEPLAQLDMVETLRDGRYARSYPGEGLARFIDRRAQALPGHFARTSAALQQAGERVHLIRKARDEFEFSAGLRGGRRVFLLRANGPLLPQAGPF